jgi:hypothetical protein
LLELSSGRHRRPATGQCRLPSFREIANKEGQSAGSIMAHIVVPKHPMPSIPLTQGELADLAAYIFAARVEVTPAANCIDGQRTLMPMIG